MSISILEGGPPCPSSGRYIFIYVHNLMYEYSLAVTDAQISTASLCTRPDSLKVIIYLLDLLILERTLVSTAISSSRYCQGLNFVPIFSVVKDHLDQNLSLMMLIFSWSISSHISIIRSLRECSQI